MKSVTSTLFPGHPVPLPISTNGISSSACFYRNFIIIKIYVHTFLTRLWKISSNTQSALSIAFSFLRDNFIWTSFYVVVFSFWTFATIYLSILQQWAFRLFPSFDFANSSTINSDAIVASHMSRCICRTNPSKWDVWVRGCLLVILIHMAKFPSIEVV